MNHGDEADRAEYTEQLDRDTALANALNNKIVQDQCFDDAVVICCDCDEPINKERLKAQPMAFLCVSCMERLEKSNKSFFHAT